jgi:hypothetical protein
MTRPSLLVGSKVRFPSPAPIASKVKKRVESKAESRCELLRVVLGADGEEAGSEQSLDALQLTMSNRGLG